MMYPRCLLPLFGCLVLLACSGCPGPVDIATRGFTELKGAEDEVQAIIDISQTELASHIAIRLDQVLSSIGPLLPADFAPLVTANLRNDLARIKGMSGRDAPLKLVGRIIYWQTSGSVETLRGKPKMAIMHVTATAEGDRKVAEFLVIATSDALRTSDMEMAQALARGTARYFQTKLPKQ